MVNVKTTRLLVAAFAAFTLALTIWPAAAFAQSDGQETVSANSWRYADDQLVASDETTDEDGLSVMASAWSKTSSGYVSSDGTIISGAVAKGIDVSQWQGKINWQSVKNSGIDFAIIRIGYGDNETSQDDSYWSYNVSECERLGIPYGVYIYSYANTADHAVSESAHCLRLLQGHTPTLPVYLDLEDNCISRTFGTSTASYSIVTMAFCSRIEAAGYQAGVYANLSWWNTYLTDSSFNGWDRWVAQWNSRCTYSKSYSIWQCADDASVSGVSGGVDLNFLMNSSSLSQSVYSGFRDVQDTSAWYYQSVYTAADLDLMKGYDNGLFGVGDTLSRADAAVILWRYFASSEAKSYNASSAVNTTGMSDVPSGAYYTGAANWAVSHGVINGEDGADGNRYFNPTGAITREQLCTIIANAVSSLKGVSTSGASQSKLNSMPDASQVSDWATNSVAWCLNKGVISGVESANSRWAAPQWAVDRASAAAILVNLVNSGVL